MLKKDDEYINEIWSKYNLYLKNKDERKKIFKYDKNIKNKVVNIAAATLISVVSLTGFAYASYTVYNNYIQKNSNSNFNEFPNYDYSQDMTYSNGIYYKKIDSYEEYSNYKKMWSNLVDMTSDDFNNNFIVITAVENPSMLGISVSNITTDQDNLYIDLIKKDDSDKNNTILSVKISKENERNNIVVCLKDDQPTSSTYKSIDLIKKDYSKEQAIADNCFVLEMNKIVSTDKEKLNNFIEKTKNGSNEFIRIVSYCNSEIIVQDIEYKNNKYLISQIIINGDTSKKYSSIGTKTISKKTNLGTIIYLIDDYGKQIQVCAIQ